MLVTVGSHLNYHRSTAHSKMPLHSPKDHLSQRQRGALLYNKCALFNGDFCSCCLEYLSNKSLAVWRCSVSVYLWNLCTCVFVYLCICVVVYMRDCVFVVLWLVLSGVFVKLISNCTSLFCLCVFVVFVHLCICDIACVCVFALFVIFVYLRISVFVVLLVLSGVFVKLISNCVSLFCLCADLPT